MYCVGLLRWRCAVVVVVVWRWCACLGLHITVDVYTLPLLTWSRPAMPEIHPATQWLPAPTSPCCAATRMLLPPAPTPLTPRLPPPPPQVEFCLTAEEGEDFARLQSLQGLDGDVYYRSADMAVLNTGHAVVRQLVVDALHHWSQEYQVGWGEEEEEEEAGLPPGLCQVL